MGRGERFGGIVCWIIFIVVFLACLVKGILFPEKVCQHFNPKSKPFKGLLMKNRDHDILLSIMKRTDQLLHLNHLEYFLIAGSLLGSMRYQHRLPWDDDIDIGILEKEKFENLPFSDFGLSIRRVYFGYKIYDTRDYSHVKFESTFPFVDVFLFTEKDGEYIYSSEKARRLWEREKFTQDQLFPLGKCMYAGMELPCPRKSKEFLDRAFPGWREYAYISGSHTGEYLFRDYKMVINPQTTEEVQKYLAEIYKE